MKLFKKCALLSFLTVGAVLNASSESISGCEQSAELSNNILGGSILLGLGGLITGTVVQRAHAYWKSMKNDPECYEDMMLYYGPLFLIGCTYIGFGLHALTSEVQQ